MSLVSLGVAGLSNAVDKVYADQPLLRCKLNFSCEFVDVPDEGREDDSLAIWTLGTNVIDHLFREMRIELCLGRHDDEVCGCGVFCEQAEIVAG